jgi:hypothetical protein
LRLQIGKRTGLYKPPKEVPKTKVRLFVESRMKHNLSIKEDYLSSPEVMTAININALEQRMITMQKVIKLLDKGYSKEKLVSLLEEEIHMDLHLLPKNYKLRD